MKYVVSLSCGKDSLAMLLRLLEERKPITHVVFYDTGMEFECIYRILDILRPMLHSKGIHLEILRPKTHFLEDMLLKPVNVGKANEHYGYDWCGGVCRWRTANKIKAINEYLISLGEYIQYIGIAIDEPNRIKNENNKIYPLVEWGMTELDCLNYCYEHGFYWEEEEIHLYDILDRVSCWCCSNKNLKELKNMYIYLPSYWLRLKALQSRIDRPFRRSGETIFDLEKRFEDDLKESGSSLELIRSGIEQLSIFDYL